MTSDSYSDAIPTSPLTPAPSGGRFLSHSHRLEDLLEASSFVSAWNLYVELISHCPSVAKDHFSQVEKCSETNVCATPILRLEAQEEENSPTGHRKSGLRRGDGAVKLVSLMITLAK